MVKNLLVGGSLSWTETPYFHYEWCQSCLSAPKCKIVFKQLYLGNKVGLKLKICRELNCDAVFEQVAPSRNSRKKEKAWGQICPLPPSRALKGPKYAGSERVILVIN